MRPPVTGKQLAGVQGLLGQPGVVLGVDDFDPLGTGYPEPVLHVLAYGFVGETGGVKNAIDVSHGGPFAGTS